MRRNRFLLILGLAALATAAVVGPSVVAAGADETGPTPEAGLPAQVVDFEPYSIGNKTYKTTDFTKGTREAQTKWRVISGTGNAAEIWITTMSDGRLFDLGGRYINYSDDKGLTWKSVRPLEPLVNAEGSVLGAPNGDVVGVTWDPYSGDRVLTFKYSAGEDTWYYMYNVLHTPFWDRPGIDVLPGKFTTPTGETVPYITFINGLPHDPWYYSYDGLHYNNVSSFQADKQMTEPISEWANVKPNKAFDYIQPHYYFPFTPLGGGKAITGTNTHSMFSAEDMRWHDFTLPNGKSFDGVTQTDSRGRLHTVVNTGDGFFYRMSTDGGRTWETLKVKGGFAGDFRANAAAGVAGVWALLKQQDLVYKIDISGDKPKLIREYVVGLGDDCRCGGVGFYGASGGHRFDFSSIVVFPDGKVGVSFMDSTTLMPFPTLGLEVVAPALAIELDTKLK
ncbi:MAG TPA: hypothetical protein VHJ82_10270 [Actinomycetota bacterium]|nr:hypothetical protein [Actinomycetota bacterium]